MAGARSNSIYKVRICPHSYVCVCFLLVCILTLDYVPTSISEDVRSLLYVIVVL